MPINNGFEGTKVDNNRASCVGYLKTTNPVERNVRRVPTRRANGLKADADDERIKQPDLVPTSTPNQASYVRRCRDGEAHGFYNQRPQSTGGIPASCSVALADDEGMATRKRVALPDWTKGLGVTSPGSLPVLLLFQRGTGFNAGQRARGVFD